MKTDFGRDGSPVGGATPINRWLVLATGGVWVLLLLINLVRFMRTGRASTFLFVVGLAGLLSTGKMLVTHRVVKRVVTVCAVVAAIAAFLLAACGIR